MNKIVLFLLFVCNLITFLAFGWDMINYYFEDGIHIIRDEVNRPFIVWIGLLTSLFSGMFILNKFLLNNQNEEI